MKKILVADDEEMLCKLYFEELGSEGYEVVTTSDAAGLIEIIKQRKPDLIVLDIRMGEYDGLDLLQDIRNAHYDMPVILCSAYSSFKYDVKSVAADSYVVKSTDLTELKTEINTALKGMISLPTESSAEEIGRRDRC
jgi:DNA-binding response OmpR family regulator